jgi:predicted ATPase
MVTEGLTHSDHVRNQYQMVVVTDNIQTSQELLVDN